jgi:DNA-binding transcriptional ArsR family regulator
MHNDVLYSSSPRWLDESGLPLELNQQIGAGAWEVLRRLTEADIAANLFPDWFVVSIPEIAEAAGLDRETVEGHLRRMSEEHYILLREEGDSWAVRINCPLNTPRDAKDIRQRMKAKGLQVRGISFRYLEDQDNKSRWQRTLDLYHGVFGARMNTRIAQDLRHLAENFEPGLLTEAFAAAKSEQKKSLAWIMARLYRGSDNEFVRKTK